MLAPGHGRILSVFVLEEEEEWRQRFNGNDIDDWTVKVSGFDVGENYANTFRVEDGVLKVCYDDYEGPFQNRFGHLFYKDSLLRRPPG